VSKAIVLVGGVGSRLWPMSREAYPKQFVKFFNGESLFQRTVKRLEPIYGADNLMFATSDRYRFIIENQLRELGMGAGDGQMVVEPGRKNTLPAILLAMRQGGRGEYGVFPSDHMIADQETFRRSLQEAGRLTDRYLVSLGIVPSGPHTGYGYIKPGRELGGGYAIEEFVEKPDAETADRYVRDGYLWNACILSFNSRNFLREVKKHSPEHLAVYEDGAGAYGSVEPQCVSRGVFERTSRAAVVPLDSYWNDMGSFSSFFDVMQGNGNRVVTNTEVLDVDAKDSLVMSEEGKLVGLVDVSDLVVVDTRDALLIGSKGSCQKVKEVFNYLKKEGDQRAHHHTTVYRPWGYFVFVEGDDRYRVKRVVLYPGKRMSMHCHYNRSEHWVVAKGTARVSLNGHESVIGAGESTYVPRGSPHMVANPGRISLEIVEVQIGDYIAEDDVERMAGDGVED
jgi:mannose-1-phosphate guanylyltransferase/mannose-6-phosphate isomerase